MVGQACGTGDLRWEGGGAGNEDGLWGSSVLVHPEWRQGRVLQPPWRSATPSLQQPLEGRKQLPCVTGLYPGTADLPDRMAPRAFLLVRQVPSFIDKRTQLCAQAGQGMMTGRGLEKGELESEQ